MVRAGCPLISSQARPQGLEGDIPITVAGGFSFGRQGCTPQAARKAYSRRWCRFTSMAASTGPRGGVPTHGASWPGSFCVHDGHTPGCFCKTAEADGKQEASCPLAADNFGQCLGQSRFARLYVHTHRRLQRCPLGSALDWPDDNYGGCQLEGLDEGRRGVSEVGHGVWGWANGMTTLIVSTNAGNSRAGPGNAPLLCPLYGGEWSGVPLMCHNQVKSRRREHVRGHCGEWDERHIDTQRCDGRLAGGAGAFGRWRGS